MLHCISLFQQCGIFCFLFYYCTLLKLFTLNQAEQPLGRDDIFTSNQAKRSLGRDDIFTLNQAKRSLGKDDIFTLNQAKRPLGKDDIFTLNQAKRSLGRDDIFSFYTPVFKTGRIMVYHCPSIHPSIRFTCRALT
jgi:hypothetical protein